MGENKSKYLGRIIKQAANEKVNRAVTVFAYVRKRELREKARPPFDTMDSILPKYSKLMFLTSNYLSADGRLEDNILGVKFIQTMQA